MLSCISSCNLGPTFSACFMGSSTFAYCLNSHDALCSKSSSLPALQFSLGNLTQSYGLNFYQYLVIHNSIFLIQLQDFISKFSFAHYTCFTSLMSYGHNKYNTPTMEIILFPLPQHLWSFLCLPSQSMAPPLTEGSKPENWGSFLISSFFFINRSYVLFLHPTAIYFSNQSYFSCKYACFFSFSLALRKYA